MEIKGFNLENINAWLKEQYGMSYDEVLKEYNKTVDLFAEKCREIKELKEKIYKLENKEDKMTFNMVVTLLKEFNYDKNGKEATIEFLKEMIKELESEE